MTEFSLKYLISLKPQTNVKKKINCKIQFPSRNPVHFPQSRTWLLPLSELSKEVLFFPFHMAERKPLPAA